MPGAIGPRPGRPGLGRVLGRRGGPARASRCSCRPRTRPRPAVASRWRVRSACALVAPRLTERLAARLRALAQRFAGVPGELAVAQRPRPRPPHRGARDPRDPRRSIALANVYQQTTQADAMRRATSAAYGRRSRHLGHGRDRRRRRRDTLAAWARPRPEHERGLDRASRRPSHRIDPWTLVGIEPSALATEVADGSLAGLRGDTVALPAGTAERSRRQVGDTIGMVLGDGAHVRLRVVALLDGSSRYRRSSCPPRCSPRTRRPRPQQLLVNGDDACACSRTRSPAARLTVRGASALADDFDAACRSTCGSRSRSSA